MGEAEALIGTLRDLGIRDERVLAVMARTPRALFVPPTFRDLAWANTALPIGLAQTISQPLVVAMMTQALDVTDRHKVLEIGTGSGYQTAILSPLARRIYSVERHAPLQGEAEARFAELRLTNIVTRCGDGLEGWPQQAPFDRIIVTCAAEDEAPPSLLAQLAPGGVMVVPIARSAIDQRLIKLTRTGPDALHAEDLGAVRFVPLVGGDGSDANLPPSLRRLKKGR